MELLKEKDDELVIANARIENLSAELATVKDKGYEVQADCTYRQLQDKLRAEKNKLIRAEEERDALKRRHGNLHKAYTSISSAHGLYLADVSEARRPYSTDACEARGPPSPDVREDWDAEAGAPFLEPLGSPLGSPGSPGKRKRQDDDE